MLSALTICLSACIYLSAYICLSAFNCAFYRVSKCAVKLSLLFFLASLFSHASLATQPMVDINRAGAEELADKLSGIGPAKARAIILYRELHGPFETVDELIRVKGIGPRTLEKNRAQIIVDADDHSSHSHNANATFDTGSVHSRVIMQKQTRRAVRSVIEAARRDSIRHTR